METIANDKFSELSALFTEDIVFTAASPGDTWHGEGIQQALNELRDFFSTDEVITKIVSVVHHALPGRLGMTYRLQGNEIEGGRFEYEHQAYYQIAEDRICRLRILCSGLYDPPD